MGVIHMYIALPVACAYVLPTCCYVLQSRMPLTSLHAGLTLASAHLSSPAWYSSGSAGEAYNLAPAYRRSPGCIVLKPRDAGGAQVVWYCGSDTVIIMLHTGCWEIAGKLTGGVCAGGECNCLEDVF